MIPLPGYLCNSPAARFGSARAKVNDRVPNASGRQFEALGGYFAAAPENCGFVVRTARDSLIADRTLLL